MKKAAKKAKAKKAAKPIPVPAPEPPPVKVVTRKVTKIISATVEPCYCGEEGHHQLETYVLDAPDRIKAKFDQVVFHLSLEEANAQAEEINRRSRKYLVSKDAQSETGPERVQKGGTKMKKANKKTKGTKSAAAGLSNKGRVYQAFVKGTSDVDKLLKLVKNQVKRTTVRSWLASWKRKENLPAIAKG